jgi:hypothetical protein
MEREVHDILGPLGVKESRSRLITENLREVEEDLRRGSSSSVEAKKTLRQRLKVCGRGAEEEGAQQESNDMGLAAFLLKFGEGMGTFESRCEYECSGVRVVTRYLRRCRGRAHFQALDIGSHHWSLLLHRRPRPTRPLHGQHHRPDRPDHLRLRHRRRALRLWRRQDLLHVSHMGEGHVRYPAS